MAIRETIQNRATNQSAAWTIILAMIYPLIAYFTTSGFEGIPTNTNLLFCFALIAMLLLFIANDKKQEHSNSAAKLTNPKIMEQTLDRQKEFHQGFVDAFEEMKAQMTPQIIYMDKAESAANQTFAESETQ